jgi:hypothetical protein
MSIEKRLEKRLKTEVKKLGGHALKFHSPWETGWTDRIVIMPKGKVYWPELKDTGKDLRPRQRIIKKLLESLNHEHFKIDTDEDLNLFLKHIAK